MRTFLLGAACAARAGTRGRGLCRGPNGCLSLYLPSERCSFLPSDDSLVCSQLTCCSAVPRPNFSAIISCHSWANWPFLSFQHFSEVYNHSLSALPSSYVHIWIEWLFINAGSILYSHNNAQVQALLIEKWTYSCAAGAFHPWSLLNFAYNTPWLLFVFHFSSVNRRIQTTILTYPVSFTAKLFQILF